MEKKERQPKPLSECEVIQILDEVLLKSEHSVVPGSSSSSKRGSDQKERGGGGGGGEGGEDRADEGLAEVHHQEGQQRALAHGQGAQSPKCCLGGTSC